MKHTSLGAAIVLGVGLSACATALSRSADERAALIQVSALPADRVAAIDGMFSQLNDLAMFDGVVIVDVGGDVVFQRAYGYADYEQLAPFTEHTMFRIASLSKSMTDAALAAMIVDGELRLDTHVSDYLPAFPRGDEITIEQLVEHTSGIPHPNDTAWGDGSRPVSLDEIVARLAEMPLDFAPGTREQYSNGGFAVLTRIMEIASGQSYSDFMQRLIFDPLDMRDTGVFGDSRAAIPNMANGYEPGPEIGARRHSRTYFPESRPGGGSIYASAADVLRFARAAYRDRLPGARAYPDLFGGTDAERGATGRAPGFFATAYSDRRSDIIVIILSNNYSWPTRLASNTAAMALGRPPLFTLPAIDSGLTAPADSPWIGSWTFVAGGENTLTIRRTAEGRLVADLPGDSTAALVPLAGGGYMETMFHKNCQMRPDDQNRIDCRAFSQGGFTMELHRRAG
ncbi:MAG: serine hydrolase domain-containing protein [Hyphomonadaceae bacterium]